MAYYYGMKIGFRKDILNYFEESSALKVSFAKDHWKSIEAIVKCIAKALKNGHKILLFGNGGSAADAQHIAAEFVNRFQIERRPLPAIALTTDTSIITSIGNDYNFVDVFSKQIMALGRKKDIAIGITTSGNSPNVLKGLKQARMQGLTTIGFLGRNGGKAKNLCDLKIIVNAESTSFIQEAHITTAHVICLLVDKVLYGKSR
jgi:D-sedoheptulose 7-phosphate isomerase